LQNIKENNVRFNSSRPPKYNASKEEKICYFKCLKTTLAVQTNKIQQYSL
jgi:hypothetical protein